MEQLQEDFPDKVDRIYYFSWTQNENGQAYQLIAHLSNICGSNYYANWWAECEERGMAGDGCLYLTLAKTLEEIEYCGINGDSQDYITYKSLATTPHSTDPNRKPLKFNSSSH